MASREDPSVHLVPDSLRFVYESSYQYELEPRETAVGFSFVLARRGAKPPLHVERKWVPFESGPNARCYVAWLNGKPVGCAEFTIKEPERECVISLLLVAQEHRRQGIGRALLGIVEQAGRHARSPHILVSCQAVNLGSIEALRRCGFDFWGVFSRPTLGPEVEITLGKPIAAANR